MLRYGWIVPVAFTGVLIALILLGVIDGRLQRDLGLVALYTMVVAGFNISFGYGGQLALAQIAVFAGGAYAAAILHGAGISELAVVLPVALAVAGAVGFVTGLPGMRLSHWTLALTAFFFVQLVPNLVSILEPWTKGRSGVPGISAPTVLGFPLRGDALTAVIVAFTGICLLLLRNLVMSRYGTSLLVLKHGTELASSLGLSAFRLRMSAYLVGSLPAGVAGALFAYHATFIQPDIFQFALLTLILAAAMVGGNMSIWGAGLGTALFVIVPHEIQSFQKYSVLAFGAFLIIAGASLGDGVSGVYRRLLARAVGRTVPYPQVAAGEQAASDGPRPTEDAVPGIAGSELSVRNAMKRFGGVVALGGADLDAEPGSITALIGANGAGKTTLLNAVSGLLALDDGEVRLGTDVVSGRTPQQIARAGVARTFQTPQIPEGLTVLDVAMSGCFSQGRVLAPSIATRTPRYRRIRAEDERRARRALAFVGLLDQVDHAASELPLGLRRILEVARGVAGQPAVILLDEPAAGLDPDALANLHDVLVRLRAAGATVVLVEHNVSFVMDVADVVHVMDLGQIIASGPPDEVRNNQRVVAAYLGRREEAAATLEGPGSSPPVPPPPSEVGDAVPTN